LDHIQHSLFTITEKISSKKSAKMPILDVF
jgi:hypothetical protein